MNQRGNVDGKWWDLVFMMHACIKVTAIWLLVICTEAICILVCSKQVRKTQLILCADLVNTPSSLTIK